MRITESQLRQIVREEISEMAVRGRPDETRRRLEEGPSVQKGIDKNKKVLVDVLQGMKSTPKTKTFKNMAAYEKWADSEAAEDFEIKRVYNESRSLVSEGLAPGKIESPEEFKQLVPGDRITVNGKPAVVIEYDSFGAGLTYAWEGTSVRRSMDARLAWAYEPGEIPETQVAFVGAGAPVSRPRRAPRPRSMGPYYD